MVLTLLFPGEEAVELGKDKVILFNELIGLLPNGRGLLEGFMLEKKNFFHEVCKSFTSCRFDAVD
jgi:hypothetical protein